MARANNSNTATDLIVSELMHIKRLFVLHLLNSGVEAQHIARALGTSKSTLSRLVPARLVTKPKR